MFAEFNGVKPSLRLHNLDLEKASERKKYTEKIFEFLKNEGNILLFDKKAIWKEFKDKGILEDFGIIAQKNFVTWQSIDEVKKLESRSNIQLKRRNLRRMFDMKNFHPAENLRQFRIEETFGKQRRVLWLRKLVFEGRGFGRRVKVEGARRGRSLKKRVVKSEDEVKVRNFSLG